jgi:hypothetical protein
MKEIFPLVTFGYYFETGEALRIDLRHDKSKTSGRGGGFKRGDDNPLDRDLLVVDETSMVDVMLMQARMKRCPTKPTSWISLTSALAGGRQRIYHLATADIAHQAILLDAEDEVRGDIVFLALHHPCVGDGVDPSGWLPIATDLAHGYQFVPAGRLAPRQDHGRDCTEKTKHPQRAHNQQNPAIDQV